MLTSILDVFIPMIFGELQMWIVRGIALVHQGADVTIEQGDFGLRVETYAQNIGMAGTTDLTGYNTYRLFVELSSPNDMLLAVIGDTDYPTRIQGGNNFFQSAVGALTNEAYNSVEFPGMPDLEYDQLRHHRHGRTARRGRWRGANQLRR